MNPLISIIIPTYNGERYLSETIQSIFCQKIPCEILVLDDLSEDSTRDIAAFHGCTVVLKQKRTGPVASKNIGINLARGEFLFYIDQDDLLLPGSLQLLLSELFQNKNLGLVMGQLQDFCSPDTPEKINFVRNQPYFGILTGTALFRKSTFDRIGQFPEGIITGEMLTLFERLRLNNIPWKKINRITCNRRIHSSNYGITHKKNEFIDYATLLRKKVSFKFSF